MEQGISVENDDKEVSGLKQILASNDIEQIHQIAQGLLDQEQSEEQGEQPDKRSFADKMIEMHKMSKGQPEQEMGE